MVSQTPEVNGKARNGPMQGVARGAASVLSDALDLAQLQTEMLKSDLKAAQTSMKSTMVNTVLGIGLVISGLPVLAFGIAHTIAWCFGWPPWICELAVGAVFLIVAVTLLQFSARSVMDGISTFRNSHRELKANIQWFQSTIRQTLTKPTTKTFLSLSSRN